MSERKFKCPVCERGEFTKHHPVCDACGVSFRDFIQRHKATGSNPVDPVAQAVAYLDGDPNWAYYERRGGYVWLGDQAENGPDTTPFFFPCTLSPLTIRLFITTFRSRIPGIRPREWGPSFVEKVMVRMWERPPRRRILDAGSLVIFHPDFKQIGGPGRRLIPVLGAPGNYYYYTGPELKAQQHGGVLDEFIDELMLDGPRDKRAMKQLLYWWPLRAAFPDVRAPLIVFAAKANGAGKTTAAELLAAFFFDQVISLSGSKLTFDDRLYNRLVNTPGHTVLMDNVDNNLIPLFSEALADLVTAATLQTYRLHHGGTAARQNALTYLLTVNNPVLTDELRSRAYLINFKPRPNAYSDFEYRWRGRSKEVAETVLAHIHQHWGQGQFKIKDFSFWRFPVFAKLVSQAAGALLIIPSAQSATIASEALELVFEDAGKEVKQLPIEEVVAQLSKLDPLRYHLIKQQQDIYKALLDAAKDHKRFVVDGRTIKRRLSC